MEKKEYIISDIVVRGKLTNPFSLDDAREHVGVEFRSISEELRRGLLYREDGYTVWFYENGDVVGTGRAPNEDGARSIVEKASEGISKALGIKLAKGPDVIEIEISKPLRMNLDILLSSGLLESLRERYREREVKVRSVIISISPPSGSVKLESLLPVYPSKEEMREKVVLVSCRAEKRDIALEILRDFEKLLVTR